MSKKRNLERDIKKFLTREAPTDEDNQDIDFAIHVGQLGYRVTVRRDPHRGGYVARLIAEGIGTIMEPNGSSPSDALARLVSELSTGDVTDRRIAREIELHGSSRRSTSSSGY